VLGSVKTIALWSQVIAGRKSACSHTTNSGFRGVMLKLPRGEANLSGTIICVTLDQKNPRSSGPLVRPCFLTKQNPLRPINKNRALLSLLSRIQSAQSTTQTSIPRSQSRHTTAIPYCFVKQKRQNRAGAMASTTERWPCRGTDSSQYPPI
jgi:hypothetical protein